MDIFEGLNDAQKSAILTTRGPLLILAGAGSGKTKTLTHRIANLIAAEGVWPEEILAVTFTNKAAREMRERLAGLLNQPNSRSFMPWMGTFHGVCVKLLRIDGAAIDISKNFVIYDEDDRVGLVKQAMKTLQVVDKQIKPKAISAAISNAKNQLLSPSDMLKSAHYPFQKTVARVYAEYEKQRKNAGALDFDDLLLETVRLLREKPEIRNKWRAKFKHILIDEYQDTNLAQYTLAKLLVEKHRNIFAVGDPDQSIYSWRGARYQNILNFESDFPGAKVVTLDQNYRSTSIILNAANALIEHNGERYEKKLWSQLGAGEKIGLMIAQNERKEAEFAADRIRSHILNDAITYDDIAIFYRTNAQSRIFEDYLLARKIPYTIIGGLSFYDRKEVKDILAYLRMVVSNTDLISFLRTINLPRRGLGAAALEKIAAAASERGLPIFTFCEELLAHPGLCPDLKLGARQREGLKDYVQTILRLRNQRPGMKIHELIAETLSAVRYLAYIQEDPETFQR